MKTLKALSLITVLTLSILTSCNEHSEEASPVIQATSKILKPESVTKTWHAPTDKKPLLSREYYSKSSRHHFKAKKH